jgi:hypothetical protein
LINNLRRDPETSTLASSILTNKVTLVQLELPDPIYIPNHSPPSDSPSKSQINPTTSSSHLKMCAPIVNIPSVLWRKYLGLMCRNRYKDLQLQRPLIGWRFFLILTGNWHKFRIEHPYVGLSHHKLDPPLRSGSGTSFTSISIGHLLFTSFRFGHSRPPTSPFGIERTMDSSLPHLHANFQGTYMGDQSSYYSRPRYSRASSASASEPLPISTSRTASISTPTMSTASTPCNNDAPDPQTTKKAFKKLCRWYLKNQRIPSPERMQILWDARAEIHFEDYVVWKDEVGLKRGTVFEEDGTIRFLEFPTRPHDQIVGEFNSQFDRQFMSFYANTPLYPQWASDGTTDVRYPGPRKEPDASWRPIRPPLALNAIAAHLPLQTNGAPFPTIVLEVGNSQPISDFIRIRDRMLCWKTGINVFVLVSYYRNQTRQADSLFIQVSRRDYLAPAPNPLNGPDNYPPCIVLYETVKINNRYPLVQTPLPAGARICPIPTSHLYHPDPPPTLNPPLPASFLLDIEEMRRTMERERPA